MKYLNRKQGSISLLTMLVIVLIIGYGIQGYYLFKLNAALEAKGIYEYPLKKQQSAKEPVNKLARNKDKEVDQKDKPKRYAPPIKEQEDTEDTDKKDLDLSGYWNNLEENMLSMNKKMKRLFDEAVNGLSNLGNSAQGDIFSDLDIELKESEKEFTIRLSAPNMELKDLQVYIRGDNLYIEGNKEEFNQEKDEKGAIIQSEKRHRSFLRSLRLPKPVDAQSLYFESDENPFIIRLKKKRDMSAVPEPIRATAY